MTTQYNAVCTARSGFLLGCLLMLTLLPGIGLGAESASWKVLSISSYHAAFPWTRGCEQGLEAALGPAYRFEYHYLDSKRRPLDEVRAKAERLWQAVLDDPPDLIVLGDDNALHLLGPKVAQTAIPMVFYGINQNPRHYFSKGLLPANVTGVIERMPVRISFRYFSKLMPKARRALVLFDRSATSQALIEQNFASRLSPRFAGIEVDYRVVEGWQSWQQAIEGAQNYDFILLGTFFTLRDSVLGTVPAEAVVRWSAAHSAVPILTTQSFAVGADGALGAVLIEPHHHGRVAAGLVRRILQEGQRPIDLRPEMDREALFFINAAQLQRFGLQMPDNLRSSVLYQ